MTVFTLAGLQLELTPHQDNFELIRSEVLALKKRFPNLGMVLLSELCTFGPAPRFAEALPGPAEDRYAELAAEAELYLITGSLFERDRDRIYNTASAIDPQGQVIARYRKIYPFLPYEEGVSSGEEFVLFDVPGAGRFGLSICYDMWFPETTRALVWQGAEVILHPTLTNTVDRDVELAITRASAASHQCYMVDINGAGRMAVGRSIVAGPGGEVIHQAGAQHEAIVVDIDFDYLRRVRRTGWHHLGQPLKSFRDNAVQFPQYQGGRSEVLESLGPLIKGSKVNWSD
ncbi:carbon-nitrogen hydrolase family protein [Bowmanella dokdonensis]|uniref:Carbon-nitrogen hydrolase family protein n=1 Tax=Bowmanella dokdonensis TaxID=751969 RepID=A0A939IQ80_9ALTE|nr:carbon-nitrogen hydrolase family protein [Bowmanella dokdonensis]MBN7824191.1 carbon-nitrogen hydrolase family protein [Bowmanella dokdonensis]